MQQLLAPGVFLTLALNVQGSLSLNTRNFLTLKPILLRGFVVVVVVVVA